MMTSFPNPPLKLIKKCKTNQICVDDKLLETIDCDFCKNIDLQLLYVLCHTNEICVHYADQNDNFDETKYKFIDILAQYVPHKTTIYIYPSKLDQTNTNHESCVHNLPLHNLKMYVYNTFKNQIYKTRYIHCDCKHSLTNHIDNQDENQNKNIDNQNENRDENQDENHDNQNENIDNQDELLVCKIAINGKKIEFVFTPICIHNCEKTF